MNAKQIHSHTSTHLHPWTLILYRQNSTVELASCGACYATSVGIRLNPNVLCTIVKNHKEVGSVWAEFGLKFQINLTKDFRHFVNPEVSISVDSIFS